MKRRNIAILVALFIGAVSLDVPYIFDATKSQLTDKVESFSENRKKNKIKFYQESASKKFEKRDYKGAINDITKAIKTNPEKDSVKRELYEDRIRYKGRIKDYQGQYNDYEKLLAITPIRREQERIIFKRAWIKRFYLKEYIYAIYDYTQVIENSSRESQVRDAYYERGLTKEEMGDISGAIADLNEYVERYRIGPRGYTVLGRLNFKVKDYLKSVSNYDKAITIGETYDWDLSFFNKDANYLGRATAKLKLKDYIGAIDDFDIVVKSHSEGKKSINDESYARAYTQRGIAKAQIKDYLGAIDDQKKAMKIYPSKDGANSNNLSKIYYLAGDMVSSCSSLKIAKNMGHKDATKIFHSSRGTEICKSAEEKKKQGLLTAYENWFKSAMENIKKGYFKSAIYDFDMALTFNKSGDAYYNRGNAYRDLKDYRAAISDYSKAIEINPNDYEAYHNRGNANIDLKNYKKGFSDYKKALELKPNFYLVYFNRGNAYRDTEKYKKAISDYTKAIEIIPNFLDAYFNSGSIKLFKTKDYLAAISDFNRAIEINPRDTNLYFLRALAKEKSGDLEGACSDANEAKSRGKFDPRNQGFIDRVCK